MANDQTHLYAGAEVNIGPKVKELIAEQLGLVPDAVTDSANLEELGADSLDRVELVMALEEEFEIAISDEDGEKLRTVQQAIDYIGARAKRG